MFYKSKIILKYFFKNMMKHMEKCLISLVIRGMQTKTPMRYYYTSTRMGTIFLLMENNKCWCRCKEIRTLMHFYGTIK